MPDEQNSNNPADNPDSQPMPDAAAISTIEKRVMALESQSCSHTKEDKTNQLERDIKKGEFVLIGINAALLITTIVIACIYSSQLDEMRKATQATDESLRLAQDASETSDGNFYRMMRQTIHQTAAQLKSAQAAQNAVKLAQDQMRVDQRAWLGAQDSTYSIAESGPIHSSVFVTNSGRSPAVEIVCKMTGITKEERNAIRISDIIYPADLQAIKAGTLFPNTHIPLIAGGIPMDPEMQKIWFKNIQSSAWGVYFFGEIQYRDIFGKEHWTHFCNAYVPDTKSGAPCAIYNETDDIKNNHN
jgi:hypothetical protein